MADVISVTAEQFIRHSSWPPRRRDGEFVSLVEWRQVEIVRRAARRGCRRIDPASPWWSVRHYDTDQPEPPSAA